MSLRQSIASAILAAIVLCLCARFALAADQLDADVLIEINEARLSEGIPAVAQSATLAQAAAITADWLGYANRRNSAFVFHNVNTAWALKKYPDLDWARLYATFPAGLPEQLSAFDVARLCGWNGGFVADLEGEVRRNGAAFDVVYGWAHSDERSPPTNHWMVLFDVIADFDACGVASEPRGGGRQIVVAVFGVQQSEQ